MTMQQIEALIETMVKALVDNPEQVVITSAPGEDGATHYMIEVAPGEAGKVIGKEGRIANALRTIAKSAAMKHKQKVYIEIVV